MGFRYAKNTGRSNIEIDTNIFHEIPGNYSETVTTPFFRLAGNINASATYSKKRSIINLNDRGALLSTTLIHPKFYGANILRKSCSFEKETSKYYKNEDQ